MKIKNIKTSQEQAVAAWIGYLRVLRIETLMDKLSAQDCNLQKALQALTEVKQFIADPSHILGSFATKHGEVAEHMQVGFMNAEAAIEGQAQQYTFDGVGRLAMEDYLKDGLMVQSKFYNGVKGTFQAICKHFNDYPSFIAEGGTYDIPKEQYEKIIDIYQRGEAARSTLMRSEETLFKSLKEWEQMNKVQIKDVIKPAVVGYDEVQLGVADRTISAEEGKIKTKDNEIRQEAYNKAKPSLSEGAKATLVGAALEGGISFGIKVYQKKKAGIKIQDFTEKDWKEVGAETLIGTGKGAIRGSVVYTLTNYTSIPSPLASAMVTATFGVTAQARRLNAGTISKEEFIDNCEVVCLDVAVSALSSMVGEVIIPIPVFGALIGNTVGMFMYEISKTYLTTTEQKLISTYKTNCDNYLAKLEAEYENFASKIKADIEEYDSIINLAFNEDLNKQIEAAISLAICSGADTNKILKTREERDEFFSEC